MMKSDSDTPDEEFKKIVDELLDLKIMVPADDPSLKEIDDLIEEIKNASARG